MIAESGFPPLLCGGLVLNNNRHAFEEFLDGIGQVVHDALHNAVKPEVAGSPRDPVRISNHVSILPE